MATMTSRTGGADEGVGRTSGLDARLVLAGRFRGALWARRQDGGEGSDPEGEAGGDPRVLRARPASVGAGSCSRGQSKGGLPRLGDCRRVKRGRPAEAEELLAGVSADVMRGWRLDSLLWWGCVRGVSGCIIPQRFQTGGWCVPGASSDLPPRGHMTGIERFCAELVARGRDVRLEVLEGSFLGTAVRRQWESSPCHEARLLGLGLRG